MSGQNNVSLRIDASSFSAGIPQNSIRETDIPNQMARFEVMREEAYSRAREKVEMRKRTQLSRMRENSKKATLRTRNVAFGVSDPVRAVRLEITALWSASDHRIEAMEIQLTQGLGSVKTGLEELKNIVDNSTKRQNEIEIKFTDLVSKMTAKEEDAASVSKEILQQVKVSIMETEGTEHEFFCPGELDEIRSNFTIAELRHEKGQYDGIFGQMCIVNAVKLKDKIARNRARWEGLFAVMVQAAEELDAEILLEEKRSYVLKTSSGPQERPANIDSFSDGRLSVVRTRHNEIMEKNKTV